MAESEAWRDAHSTFFPCMLNHSFIYFMPVAVFLFVCYFAMLPASCCFRRCRESDLVPRAYQINFWARTRYDSSASTYRRQWNLAGEIKARVKKRLACHFRDGWSPTSPWFMNEERTNSCKTGYSNIDVTCITFKVTALHTRDTVFFFSFTHGACTKTWELQNISLILRVLVIQLKLAFRMIKLSSKKYRIVNVRQWNKMQYKIITNAMAISRSVLTPSKPFMLTRAGKRDVSFNYFTWHLQQH